MSVANSVRSFCGHISFATAADQERELLQGQTGFMTGLFALAKSLDQALSACLAATLAGLALVATAFLLPLETNFRLTGRRNIYKGVREAKCATKSLTRSFYAFVVLLENSVTLDLAVELKQQWTPPIVFDLGISGAAMAGGTFFLVTGGRSVGGIMGMMKCLDNGQRVRVRD